MNNELQSAMVTRPIASVTTVLLRFENGTKILINPLLIPAYKEENNKASILLANEWIEIDMSLNAILR